MNTRHAPAVRPAALAFLPPLLFRADRPARYILVAWALSLAGSLALSAVISQAMEGKGPTFPSFDPWWLLFNLVVVAPVGETLIMGTVLLLLERLFGFTPALLLSSAGWGLAHSLLAPAWGLVIWWPFLLFSLSFLVWRRRGLAVAFLVPALIHALQNLGPALLLVLGGGPQG